MRKILIVDDSALVRDRLIQLLARLQEMEIVGEAGDAERGRELTRKLKPDVIIIDVQMRNGGGIDLLQDMKRIDPAPHVIVLTNEAYPEIRNRCLDAGADYFFDKSAEYQEMVAMLSGARLKSSSH
jgi:two-component system OmpR family response regulator